MCEKNIKCNKYPDKLDNKCYFMESAFDVDADTLPYKAAQACIVNVNGRALLQGGAELATSQTITEFERGIVSVNDCGCVQDSVKITDMDARSCVTFESYGTKILKFGAAGVPTEVANKYVAYQKKKKVKTVVLKHTPGMKKQAADKKITMTVKI